jgi:hypothetical protein
MVRIASALILLAFLTISACELSAQPNAVLRAGSARRVITPHLQRFGPVYMAGFANNRVATAIHDDLFARCLVLEAGGKAVALCSADVIGIFWEDAQAIRRKARAASRRQDLDLIIAATHNHEGPDTMGLWGPRREVSGLNESYMEFLQTQVAEAAAEALRNARPASATLARISDPLLTASYDDTRPPVLHDDLITSLALRDETNGELLGMLVNWNSHPEALGSRNTEITADYLAIFYKALDRPNASVVFWNGAVGGMQSPLGGKIPDPSTGQVLREPTFAMADALGLQLAKAVRLSLARAKPLRVDGIQFAESMVHMEVTNQGFLMASKAGLFKGRKPMGSDASMKTPVGLLRLTSAGRPVLEAALIPGEAYPELSVGGIADYPGADFPKAPREKPYRQLLSAPFRMVVGLANDEIGYIIPKAEWDEKPPYLQNAPKDWYGEVNSPGPDTAAAIAEALAELVRQPRR